ncbi:uncharacterized protein LOC116265970 [Nymphaea colorata]|uniref:uncharacterized protein LOC116265970 n=1 Tax=Nymphaea colorata TaxID=210225 RepID=UPI00129DF71C|nr:uncharacterized protein LOC116265970 [Nymphaea colorata]
MECEGVGEGVGERRGSSERAGGGGGADGPHSGWSLVKGWSSVEDQRSNRRETSPLMASERSMPPRHSTRILLVGRLAAPRIQNIHVKQQESEIRWAVDKCGMKQ